MNIIYGLSGEGYGHSSRALLIIPFLQKLGHKVKVLTHGKGSEVLKDKFDVFEIHGAQIVFESNKIHKRKTVLQSISKLSETYLDRHKIRKMIEDFKPDLCITDYELLTYTISRIYHVPLISIGNHQIIDLVKIKFPKKYYGEYLLVKAINKTFTPSADYFIITSFLKPDVKKKNIFIVPPEVREDIKKLRPRSGGNILVYLSKYDYRIFSILKEIPQKFVIYGLNEIRSDKNLEFKKKETFLNDLKDCNAIISTAGFTLISEALYLKKPFFALPLEGHFEQMFNAILVKDSGFGDFSERSTKTNINNFLMNLNKYKLNLKKYKHSNGELFKVLTNLLKGLKDTGSFS